MSHCKSGMKRVESHEHFNVDGKLVTNTSNCWEARNGTRAQDGEPRSSLQIAKT